MTDPSSRQRWTTPTHLARYLGVGYTTVISWIKNGELPASPAFGHHYSDERPRKTKRGTWRIYERDLMPKLQAMRASGKVAGFGPNFWRE